MSKTETTLYDIPIMSLIWANRFINIGLGRNGTKLCNDAQEKCMKEAIVEAFNAGMKEAREGYGK